ncbi:hypothetical protein F4818DRAFT_440838 [Hypoxylon cercidicola]|nr:hypothetical protein F4818DRAFT_440838 [Hypoxylon cercidicola]
MSSTLTSGAVIQSLDAVSLSKHAVIVDDHRDNTSTAKDGQDANHSPGDRPLTEDHPNDISTTSDGRDTDYSLRDPSKDGSTPGYRPPLTQEDTDFCAAVLFCFWKTNAPQADLDHNPQITAVDDISIARSNNQSALTTANSSASAKEGLPRSPQSSDIIEEYSKHTQHGGDRYKPRREKAPKRVLSEVRRTTVVILDSDGEEEMEITTTDDSLSDRLIKRPRLAKTRPYQSLLGLGSLKAFDTLDTEHCQILAEMSADRLPRSTRLQLGKELPDLEKRRSEVTAELRQAMNSGSSEGAAMKQDLEQWNIKEKKVTERIERSR